MMTDPNMPESDPFASKPVTPQPITPTRRDRLRPLELVGFSGILAAFAGLIVIMTTRDITLTLVSVGIAFIAVLLMLALIGLGKTPSAEDDTARKDLQQPDSDNWH